MTEQQCKYIKVIDYIRQGIDSQVWQHDEKLPSIRQLSQQLGVSKNTIIRAYYTLEAQGIIAANARSGYRVVYQKLKPNNNSIPRSISLLSLCKDVLAKPSREERLNIGTAHPNISTPAINSLYAEIGRHSRRQTHSHSHYQLPPGNQELTYQLKNLSNDLGLTVSQHEITVTHGAQQGISLALRAVTKPGDTVIVESPCYFGNLLLMESLGLKVIEISSSPVTGIDVSAVSNAINKWDVSAILVTPNFMNPTGAQMPLNARVELLRVSNNIPIIEDDVFGALSFNQSIPPIHALDSNKRVIYINSLSKVLDSRLRIGWVIAGRYQEVIERQLFCDTMGSTNLMQSAVADFLKSGRYRSHVKKMNRYYQNVMQTFYEELTQRLDRSHYLYKNYQLKVPTGSFLLWLELPKVFDGLAAYQQAREQRISILPGHLFATSEQYKHCLRFSCSNYMLNSHWKSGLDQLVDLIDAQLRDRQC